MRYLIQIEAVDVLPKLFGGILVPSVVLTEMCHPKAPGDVRRWAAEPPPWVTIIEPEPQPHVARLDPGETAVLNAAIARTPSVLALMDERAGRREAVRLGLRSTGTIGILHAADQRGMLDFHTALQRLRATTFYLPELTTRQITTRRAATTREAALHATW